MALIILVEHTKNILRHNDNNSKNFIFSLIEYPKHLGEYAIALT